jgi:hypothetical protein
VTLAPAEGQGSRAKSLFDKRREVSDKLEHIRRSPIFLLRTRAPTI